MMGLGDARVIGPLFLKSPEEGATTLIYLASSPAVDGLTGRYFADGQQVAPTAAAQDDVAARRLWDVSAEMVGLGVSGA